jgi:hypothetical protein
MVNLEGEAASIKYALVGDGHIAVHGHGINNAISGEQTGAQVRKVRSSQREGLAGPQRFEDGP